MKYTINIGIIERHRPDYIHADPNERREIVKTITAAGNAIYNQDTDIIASVNTLEEASAYIEAHPLRAYMYGASEYLHIPFYLVDGVDDDGEPLDTPDAWKAWDLLTFAEAD